MMKLTPRWRFAPNENDLMVVPDGNLSKCTGLLDAGANAFPSPEIHPDQHSFPDDILSGTNPQYRLSSLLSRLSPIMKK